MYNSSVLGMRSIFPSVATCRHLTDEDMAVVPRQVVEDNKDKRGHLVVQIALSVRDPSELAREVAVVPHPVTAERLVANEALGRFLNCPLSSLVITMGLLKSFCW